ncbi:zinc finger protein 420-like [Macrobrachium rosenbergii]|uniref:zinc finger protein 420-like n=1 Tax=Macrobrachium rosenbergii TaxID=79674 RepID=UPI0034D7390D
MALTKNATTLTMLDTEVEPSGESEIPMEVSCNSHDYETATEKQENFHIEVSPESDTSQSISNLGKESAVNQKKHKAARKRVTERSFVCNICGKKFLHAGHYSRHCKIHKANTLRRKKSKSVSVRPVLSGEISTAPSSYSYPKQGLYQSDLSLTEHKQTINRSFICVICGKGFGRNSHLKRHIKLHKGKNSLSFQKEQPELQIAQAKSSILQAILSGSSTSETVEHSDCGSSDNSKEQARLPVIIPSEITMVKSESCCSFTGKSPDVIGSALNQKTEDSCSTLELSLKSSKRCNVTLLKSSVESKDFVGDGVYVKLEQNDHSILSDESLEERSNEPETHFTDSVSVDKINQESGKDLFCQICGKAFGRKSHLTRHIKLHVNKEIHDCEICGKRFLQSAYLKAHVSTVHAAVKQELEKIFGCPICDKKFGRMSHLKRHMKLHVGGETYDCKVCGKKFLQNSNLKSHEKSHADLLTSIDEGLVKRHVDERTNIEYFDCEQCGKSFQQISSLKAHINTVHIGRKIFEKCFECSYCGKEFGRNSHLKRHLKLHIGGQTFTCELCGRGFKQNGNLKAHIRMVHLKERPHQCTYCGKMFLQQSNLNTHIRTHTGEKPYGCTICGKNFTQGNQLKYHMRTHYGETPFSCLFCGKTFTNNRSCQRHLKIHAGENPLECGVCLESFNSEDEVKAHLREHTKQSIKNHNRNSRVLKRPRNHDSLVVVAGSNDSGSEGGAIDSEDGNTSDNVTYIKDEVDVIVKEEPEAYECASDYGSTNESETLSYVVGDDTDQDNVTLTDEHTDFQDVIKSVNESIKGMTKNKTLSLQQPEKDFTDAILNDNNDSLEGLSVGVEPECLDPLGGV